MIPNKLSPIDGSFDRVFVWRNNSKRAQLYGRRCKILQRLKQNSAIVEFANGQREVVSRNGLRRIGDSLAQKAQLNRVAAEMVAHENSEIPIAVNHNITDGAGSIKRPQRIS